MEEIEGNQNGENPELESGKLKETVHLSQMYQSWFLDYASYVILERAVPEITDGLKPVQRRILHAMRELDDGRYNKVANIIGHTMKYHPHGDASIGDALVQLGQKDLLVDCQGNWGNILTGDSAAAPRYIEARPSKFAHEVLYNPKTTTWQASYDGRNKEPVAFPVKFPLLLAQGVEGIAVGLASKLLPHNFNELIDASINILEDKDFEILPDFPTGGMIDASRYNDGLRGGKIRLRAKIILEDKKTLVIREIPFGTTTGSLIDSILTANDKGKIKIRKIDDNTAADVEILIHLSPGVSPDTTIDALYAFTECEISISPNACVIENGHPRFMGVSDILRYNTRHTVELLQSELDIRMKELKEQLHYVSLEKIFIENELYEGIKKCRTTEEIDAAIYKSLEPFADQLIRPVNDDDVMRLRKIPIERISRYNSAKADASMDAIRTEITEVAYHLDHLTEYAIAYYRRIREKFGKGRERRTEIRNFDTIEAVKVAAANEKLYVNREEGFAGTSLKKDEYVCDCSDIDDIIAFRDDGTFLVVKVAPKIFVGKNIIHVAVFNKNDSRTVYNMIYRDGKNGKIMVKRFSVLGINRDKEYTATKGTAGSKVLYFTANPNGEAEMVKVDLRPKPRLKKTSFEFNFAEVAIKGRSSIGNILTKLAVRKIEKRQEGVSTLGSLNIWYDDTVQRLNTDGRGILLGAFSGADRIITIQQSGTYRLTSFDLSTHFDEDMIMIRKFDPELIYTVIYQEQSEKQYYIKRFCAELTDRKVEFIDPKDQMTLISIDPQPVLHLRFDMSQKSKGNETEEIRVEEFIGVKSHKAKGKRLSSYTLASLEWMIPEDAAEDIAEDVAEGISPEEIADAEANTEITDITLDTSGENPQDHAPTASEPVADPEPSIREEETLPLAFPVIGGGEHPAFTGDFDPNQEIQHKLPVFIPMPDDEQADERVQEPPVPKKRKTKAKKTGTGSDTGSEEQAPDGGAQMELPL